MAMFFSCAPSGRNSSVSLNPNSENKLEAELIKINYPDLFMFGSRNKADKIWASAGGPDPFEQIIDNDKSDIHGVFLAAEVLRYKDYEILKDGRHDILARAYVAALQSLGSKEGKKTYQLNGNLWGFLTYTNDPGHLGSQLIKIGNSAIKLLFPLLEDESKVIYEGSRDATTGDWLNYRLKDFAAFYLAKILELDLPHHQDHPSRDLEIERIKEHLQHGKK